VWAVLAGGKNEEGREEWLYTAAKIGGYGGKKGRQKIYVDVCL
jgi:hypothetical protein